MRTLICILIAVFAAVRVDSAGAETIEINFEASANEFAEIGADATDIYQGSGVVFPSGPVIGRLFSQVLHQSDLDNRAPSCEPLVIEIRPVLRARRVELTSLSGNAHFTVEAFARGVSIDRFTFTHIPRGIGDPPPLSIRVVLRADPGERDITRVVVSTPQGCLNDVIIDDLLVDGEGGVRRRTFTVDTFYDFGDWRPGDGVCRGYFPGVFGCSLRAAVMEANANPGRDVIRIPDGRYVLRVVGPESDGDLSQWVRDLDVTESLTIAGSPCRDVNVEAFLRRSADPETDLTDDGGNAGFARIDGNGAHRLFHISGPRVTLQLRCLAVVNGFHIGRGGAVFNAGGELRLDRVALAGNRAFCGLRDDPDRGRFVFCGYGGGAIQNDGLLSATEVAFLHNTAQGEHPAGGGIYNTGAASIRRSLFAYNDGYFGAAIYNRDGLVTLRNVTLHKHRTAPELWVGSVLASRGSGKMELTLTTFSAQESGFLMDPANNFVDTMRSTLMNDRRVDLCHVAIVSQGGNVVAGDCGFSHPDYSPPPPVPDHSEVGPVEADDQLVQLEGFTPVIAIRPPAPGSRSFSAIDRGFQRSLGTDQRGLSRPVDGDGDGISRSDAGAYEYHP